MSGFYGQIDLTKLGDIVRQHPEAIHKYKRAQGNKPIRTYALLAGRYQKG